MQKNLLICLLGVLLCSSACNAQNNTQPVEKELSDFEKADTELNDIFQEILSAYSENDVFIESLRQSQRIWINFRDAELEMKYPGEDKRVQYGSVYTMCAEQYLSKMTNERTSTLRQWLTGIEEGNVCGGSVRMK